MNAKNFVKYIFEAFPDTDLVRKFHPNSLYGSKLHKSSYIISAIIAAPLLFSEDINLRAIGTGLLTYSTAGSWFVLEKLYKLKTKNS